MNDLGFPTELRGTLAPVHMWANEWEVEHSALNQLRNIASLPWVHGVRVMPDVHIGKGATVGSVIAMRQAVSPNAVGVDIGCGVVAVRTSLREEDLERLPQLRAALEDAIPTGFDSHSKNVNVKQLGLEKGWDNFWKSFKDLDKTSQRLEGRAHAQMGTLGGGNHFVEVCVDEAGEVWLTLHSGSRNIGKALAEHHIGIAQNLSHNSDLVDRDLAVFISGTPQMDSYRHDLMWAQEYALRSRSVMMALFRNVLRNHYGESKQITFDSEINVHHNYVSEEIIDGEEMLVTRKGAISARSGELALIPGSMGTGSYIVRGLGNDSSYQSASHGAGRKMSRSEAKDRFTVEDLIAQTAGVESRKDQGVVDEIPGAYKDIHEVIDAQSDLVEVVQHLRTVLCVKG